MSQGVMNTLLITRSPKETQRLGYKIGKLLKRADVVALIGELGSGKTCLVQGLMEGLGVLDNYKGSSPSFVLINEYKGRVPVYHFDIYRLDNVEEVVKLGYEEYFYGKGVTIIEWADKIEKLLPPNCIRIYLKILNEKEREVKIEGIEVTSNRSQVTGNR